ncbi:MAG: peptide chain release factor N(5)-glutamine methyltransferase [Cyclobacteriaceae bacterium]
MVSSAKAKEVLTHLQKQLRPEVVSRYSVREVNTMLEWLLEHFAQITKVDLLLDKPVSLSEPTYQKLEQAMQRLNQEEPIQYIIEEAEFYGRKFFVNPEVLIPRQETEELVQLILHKNANTTGLRVLDIGSGSGCIAITLARELKQAQVWALDHSVGALAVARQNAKALEVAVEFLHQDILADTPVKNTFDIIVSNPPYVLKSDAAAMRRNVVSYEPPEALFVEDVNPFLFYERISELCGEILAPAGWLYFEIHEQYGAEVAGLLKNQGFAKVMVKKDLQSKDRFVVAQK